MDGSVGADGNVDADGEVSRDRVYGAPGLGEVLIYDEGALRDDTTLLIS